MSKIGYNRLCDRDALNNESPVGVASHNERAEYLKQ
jgi:hypothetical protein